jgi:hypothetical protein
LLILYYKLILPKKQYKVFILSFNQKHLCVEIFHAFNRSCCWFILHINKNKSKFIWRSLGYHIRLWARTIKRKRFLVCINQYLSFEHIHVWCKSWRRFQCSILKTHYVWMNSWNVSKKIRYLEIMDKWPRPWTLISP